MKKTVRSEMINEINSLILRYNSLAYKLHKASDVETFAVISANRCKILAQIRTAIDIACIADPDYCYYLEYIDSFRRKLCIERVGD